MLKLIWKIYWKDSHAQRRSTVRPRGRRELDEPIGAYPVIFREYGSSTIDASANRDGGRSRGSSPDG